MIQQRKLTTNDVSTAITALTALFYLSAYNNQPYLVQSFVPNAIASHLKQQQPFCFTTTSASPSIDTSSSLLFLSSDPLTIIVKDTEAKFQEVEEAKMTLVALCESKNAFLDEIRDNISYLESMIQNYDDDDREEETTTSSISEMYRWMNGEWELIYTPVDITRSSPFFWAFRQAFPDVSDQIYSVTDGIPSSIKQVGPAYQHIDFRYILEDSSSTSCSGTFVSRVKVATLGGVATSMMTTRASIVGCDRNIEENCCELRIKIETTKPEESTILQKVFGEQFGAMINDIIPPYPSGETLEQVLPGSSEVIVMTTFCDPTIRITKNKNRPRDEFFIWKRKSFNTYETL